MRGRGDAATLDPNVLGQAIASSIPAVIQGLKEAGVIDTKENRRRGPRDKKPRNKVAGTLGTPSTLGIPSDGDRTNDQRVEAAQDTE